MKRSDRKLVRFNRREWVYAQPPVVYEIAPCRCGALPYWSEFKGHLWCAVCKKDFVPKHWGILDGPVGIHVCELLGIFFDRIDIKTGEAATRSIGEFSLWDKHRAGRVGTQ
jgi:hypothetical protein